MAGGAIVETGVSGLYRLLGIAAGGKNPVHGLGFGFKEKDNVRREGGSRMCSPEILMEIGGYEM